MMESVKDNYGEKLKSPFWGSMIATWLTWNWEVWYVTLFINHDNIGKFTNKIEYIKDIYNYFDFYNLFPCVGIIFHWILMPLLLSWFIIIFVTPKISHWFLEKHKDNKQIEIEMTNKNKKLYEAEIVTLTKEKEKIALEKEKLRAEFEKEMEEKNLEMRKKAQDFADRKSKNNQQELLWDQEYDKINDVNKLSEAITELIFEHRGYNKYWHPHTDNQVYSISAENLKNGIILNLIKEESRKGSEIIYSITEKGKYFLAKSLQEQKKENS